MAARGEQTGAGQASHIGASCRRKTVECALILSACNPLVGDLQVDYPKFAWTQVQFHSVLGQVNDNCRVLPLPSRQIRCGHQLELTRLREAWPRAMPASLSVNFR